jgi:hypothetical protein
VPEAEPKPKKPRRKPHQAGPYSRDHVLSMIDKRTRAGRVYRTVIRELINHVGGDPSAAQRLLIESASIKATRLALLTDNLLAGIEPGEDGHQALAWLNSLRMDLQALGLERRARDVTSLADYLHSKRATDSAP